MVRSKEMPARSSSLNGRVSPSITSWMNGRWFTGSMPSTYARNCAAGKTCVNGACVAVCEPLTSSCSGNCVNFKSNPKSCGSCTNSCGLGSVCSAGSCVGGGQACANGETKCPALTPNSCANLQTDSTNCGACGNDCGPTRLCVAGNCVAFVWAQAAQECGGTWPKFCSNARTENKGVCVSGMTCP